MALAIQTVEERLPIYSDVLEASELVGGAIRNTPVLESGHVNSLCGASVYFKCENFQKTGAFKIRGALNAVLGLEDQSAPLVAHSSGNHGIAVSYIARLRGRRAIIAMPSTVSRVKQEAAIQYGGEVTLCEPSMAAREAAANRLAEQSGGIQIHSYNNYRVIAGQGTCTRELIEETDGLDAVIVPVGGGSLISGTCISASHLVPGIQIYGAVPEQADDAYRSLRAGRIISDDRPATVAEGLKVSLKEMTWRFVQQQVNDIFRVSEGEILSAMKLVLERMKILIEPSSAVAVAALLRNRDIFIGKKVGLVLSGGNVDVRNFQWNLIPA